ncbi:hypothetical protein TL16_g03877 [Triparma laevis f. inornata]|uniref:Uncharacterized protein n=2 Tax=Triparma laevis TaxID=1534972 RepID=A0A9W7E114_9STRA|nr:hypothetical protein TL16_g03877 [Triparma laevis f. inornata]
MIKSAPNIPCTIMPTPNSSSNDSVRMKSRWIDVEKTVSMLSATSCPASTVFTMTGINISTSISNKIDYKLKPATVKEMISHHLLAECSVAFRDYCKSIPRENNKHSSSNNKSSAPLVFVQSQELVYIFREVEDKWGAPVVNEMKLKNWVKKNGFGRNQALGYHEFLRLCKHLIDPSDPINSAPQTPHTIKNNINVNTAKAGVLQKDDTLGLSFSSSWEQLPYEDFGKLPQQQYKNAAVTNPDTHMLTTKNPQELASGSSYLLNQGSSIVELDPANASAFMSQSQHQQNIDALNQSQDNSYIDVPSTPAVPYAITQRKAAAASLFEYDADAPDITLPASVPPGEMVELVKKQNRENRKRLKKELKKAARENTKLNQPPIGDRLFDAQLESVSVEGEHLVKTSKQEIFNRTQTMKRDTVKRIKHTKTNMAMANTLNTKLAVVLTQITESKAKQIGRDFFTKKFERVAERKQNEKKAKMMMDAKAERKGIERRKTALTAKHELDKQLVKQETSSLERLQKISLTRSKLERQSVSAMGFPGTSPQEKKSSRLEKKLEKKQQEMRYSKSLNQLQQLKESRKGKKHISDLKPVDVNGGELFDDSEPHFIQLETGSQGQGSPGITLDRPRSRHEIQPPSMFSAERIYDKGRLSPPQVPFGTTAARSSLTPGTVLRDISSPGQLSPESRILTAGDLISSPTPWGSFT